MATVETLADTVKTAIAGGNVTASTVTTLQALLGTESTPDPGSESQATAARKAARSTTTSSARATRGLRNARPVQKRATTRKAQDFQVHEDAARSLSPKARYALATHVINVSLKVLSNAAKPATKHNRRLSSAQGPATPQRLSRTPSSSQRALQLRSANSTPLRKSPAKPSATPRGQSTQPSNQSAASASLHVSSVAECARLGFHYLRSIDPTLLGVHGPPQLQLEAGMLALVTNLLHLGLLHHAAKELRACKRRFEAFSAKTGCSAAKPASSEAATLASLLRLDFDFEALPTAWHLILTYYMNSLQLIALTGIPSVVEQSLQYLSLQRPWSPPDLVLRLAKHNSEPAKSVKQLESLSRAILGFCPATATSADDQARDTGRSPRPLVAFKLQAIALRLRREMLSISQQESTIEEVIIGPFSKSLATLVRRHTSDDEQHMFKVCLDEAEQMNSLTISSTAGSIHPRLNVLRILSSLAEKAGSYERALDLATEAETLCFEMADDHISRIAVRARKACVLLAKPGADVDRSSVSSELQILSDGLQNTCAGTPSEHGVILLELSHLLRLIGQITDHGHTDPAQQQILGSAAYFASRYVRSFPGENLEAAQEIVRTALSLCGSDERQLSWVTHDVAYVLTQFGTLEKIAMKMRKWPLISAWSSFSAGVSFGRLVKILILRAAAADPGKCCSLVFDDETLPCDQRGSVLEWQLKCALDVAHKPKYLQSLRRLLPDLFERLSKSYSVETYPLRRKRVAAAAFRSRELFPGLLPPHSLQVFTSLSSALETNLADDDGLEPFAKDITASLAVSRAFHEGMLNLGPLEAGLSAWQTLLGDARTSEDLQAVIEDPSTLRMQLLCIDSYLDALGHGSTRLPVLRMLVQVDDLCNAKDHRTSDLIRLARAYLSLGYAEKCMDVALRTSDILIHDHQCKLDLIDRSICRAQCFLALDRLEHCRSELKEAMQHRSQITPNHVPTAQKQRYQSLHGEGWLVNSRFAMSTGAPDKALRFAKRAVRIFNSIWASLESQAESLQPQTQDVGIAAERPSMDVLAQQVSKLNLKPASTDCTKPKPATRGATFWPTVQLLCQSLMHLSSVYTHHGAFSEANYSSQQAVKIATVVNAGPLLSQVRAHRCNLLVAVGRLEDAELCLAHDDIGDCMLSSVRVERLRAEAWLATKHGSSGEAVRLLRAAEDVAQQLRDPVYLKSIETSFSYADGESARKARNVQKSGHERSIITTTLRMPDKKTTLSTAKPRAKDKKTTRTPQTNGSPQAEDGVGSGCYVLRKVEQCLILDQMVVMARSGQMDARSLEHLREACDSITRTFKWHLVHHISLMRKVQTALQADFTFNVLSESTLAVPSLTLAGKRPPAYYNNSSSSSPTKQISTASRVRARKRAGTPEDPLGALLSSAKTSMTLSDSGTDTLSTAETHRQYSHLSSISMVLSATQGSNNFPPIEEALGVDYARIYASRSQRSITESEQAEQRDGDLPGWPNDFVPQSIERLSAKVFQNEYINVLPDSWTAVSLCLSETADELYLVRYRRSQTPLVLRLPFSRQRSEDADEDVFDFQMGRAELKDIIELSNYSCHNSLDPKHKPSKTDWWSEREALDRRLQELLINIENIWLGGFKGAFTQDIRDDEHFERFRNSFESILDRHLPSRKTSKRKAKKLMLDDQILELFIGLGSDEDGEVDLDASLADLLYFVVDILQFNGERNAYDEIDFDSMGVEILDDLRIYHESSETAQHSPGHLILILDRRLQAFPWESLPCLENSSVSRVDSMLTLQERILSMRQENAVAGHTVSMTSGSYILNPSSDLQSTETTLMPELSKLVDSNGKQWQSVVRREPSEEEFRTALSTSSMFLYFGHGAGSQYIRTRSIRRLEKCSEVVWLMGCSSGAMIEHDELEPSSVALTYLMAGPGSLSSKEQNNTPPTNCKAVVATLWDVTDKDIDRFSLTMGEEWGLWQSSRESSKTACKTPRKREKPAAQSTPEKALKNPKTPKVRKTPVAPRTPANRHIKTRTDEGGLTSLAEAVAKSRDACYLRYLNGAAPVVYGVPVYLGD